MLYLVSFVVYCYLFYRTFKDTDLLIGAEVDKSLNILSYYYLIYKRRFVFICNILIILFILRATFVLGDVVVVGISCLIAYMLVSLVCFAKTSKIKYNKDGVKISLSLFF